MIQRLLVGPATATEMANDLGVSQQAISKALKELLSLGHVETIADVGDRRRRPVTLTSTGRHAVETARATRRSIDIRLRESLGEHQFDATMAALLTALDAFDLSDRVRRRAMQPPDGMLSS